MGITLSGSRPLILSFPYSCFHSSTFIFNSALAWKNKCSIDSYCHYGNASKAFKTPNPLGGKTRLPQSYFPSPWTLNSIALFPSLLPSPLICLKTLLMSYHSLIRVGLFTILCPRVGCFSIECHSQPSRHFSLGQPLLILQHTAHVLTPLWTLPWLPEPKVFTASGVPNALCSYSHPSAFYIIL